MEDIKLTIGKRLLIKDDCDIYNEVKVLEASPNKFYVKLQYTNYKNGISYIGDIKWVSVFDYEVVDVLE